MIRYEMLAASLSLLLFCACDPSMDMAQPSTPVAPMVSSPAPEPSQEVTPADEIVALVPNQDQSPLGGEDNGESGLVGTVHPCRNLSGMTLNLLFQECPDPLPKKIVTPNLAVSDRAFTQGFPSVPDLVEWFGIRFEGTLKIAAAGNYQFRMTCDDGCRLKIDGNLVINHDGLHGPSSKDSVMMSLSEGNHAVNVDYFQGPRQRIALEWKFRTASGQNYVHVPASMIDRP